MSIWKRRFFNKLVWKMLRHGFFIIKRVFWKITLGIIFLGGIYLFFTSNFFQIQQIDLSLNKKNYIDLEQTKKTIKKETLTKNIFQLDVQKLSKKIIKQDNFIKGASVNKVLPNRLNIIIIEDLPVIKIIDKKSCSLVNINAKKLWQGDKAKCLLINLPQVIMLENDQIYYNRIYLQYIINFNENMSKNQQKLPLSYKIIAQPKVYLKLDFQSYQILLDIDVDVLYNWYRYSLVQKNLALKDYKNKTIDLTHRDVIIY